MDEYNYNMYVFQNVGSVHFIVDISNAETRCPAGEVY